MSLPAGLRVGGPCGALPEISIVFSLPSAKKPTSWPSGDKNGYVAFSVRASVTPSRRASGRTQSFRTSPSWTSATRCVPLGETANMVSGVPPPGVAVCTSNATRAVRARAPWCPQRDRRRGGRLPGQRRAMACVDGGLAQRTPPQRCRAVSASSISKSRVADVAQALPADPSRGSAAAADETPGRVGRQRVQSGSSCMHGGQRVGDCLRPRRHAGPSSIS